MFGRRKEKAQSSAPKTIIEVARDFSKVKVTTVYSNQNREEYSVSRSGHGLVTDEGEHQIMAGGQLTSELHFSRDYLKAGDPNSFDVVRHIDTVLKDARGYNVTRFLLTADLMPEGEGIKAELRNADWQDTKAEPSKLCLQFGEYHVW